MVSAVELHLVGCCEFLTPKCSGASHKQNMTQFHSKFLGSPFTLLHQFCSVKMCLSLIPISLLFPMK